MKFPLSLRNVENLLQERGIDICHETVRFWWKRVQTLRQHTHWRWRLDEVFVNIKGELHDLWRAVDHEGEVLEWQSLMAEERRGWASLAKWREVALNLTAPPGVLR